MFGVLIYVGYEMYMFVVIPVTVEQTGWNSVNINERSVIPKFKLRLLISNECFVYFSFNFVTPWNKFQ